MCVANFPILNPVELDAVGFDCSKLNLIVLGIDSLRGSIRIEIKERYRKILPTIVFSSIDSG